MTNSTCTSILFSGQMERKFNARLFDLNDELQQSYGSNRSLQNYVQFLKASYASSFNDLAGIQSSPQRTPLLWWFTRVTLQNDDSIKVLQCRISFFFQIPSKLIIICFMCGNWYLLFENVRLLNVEVYFDEFRLDVYLFSANFYALSFWLVNGNERCYD